MSTQQNRRFDALVFIGRFQPPHRGHLNVLKSALSRAERVCVLIGSTDKPRTIKDPFSFDERRQMLASLLDASERDRVTIAPLQDSTYNDGDWVRWVQEAVAVTLGDVAQRKVGLIGHEKDATSYYLRMFPQWELVDVDATEDISAPRSATSISPNAPTASCNGPCRNPCSAGSSVSARSRNSRS